MSELKIAIHKTKGSFSSEWIDYCVENGISYKIVNAYSDTIVEDLEECDVLMWHHQQGLAKDAINAQNLLFALQHSGKKVFPDFYSNWHFDNKLAQKYLLECLNIPTPKTYAFYSEESLIEKGKTLKFPIVFKLKGGSGSRNVKLLRTFKDLESIGKRAFGKGFRQYDSTGGLKEAIRRYRIGKYGIKDILKALAYFIYPIQIEKVNGREWGYVYLQEFVAAQCDYRIIIVDKRAFAIKRMVRKNDFRASGSGHIVFDKNEIHNELINLSFEYADRLKVNCIAFDFVYRNSEPLVIEISYGWSKKAYYNCPGYWTSDLRWHEGPFNPYGWMIERALKDVSKSRYSSA